MKAASFSSFVFDPDDSVNARVFQCSCGATIRPDRKLALATGWRRIWQQSPDPVPLALGEPQRPAGLILDQVRKWFCPDCEVKVSESYGRTTGDVDLKMPTYNMLLFPNYVLGIRANCVEADSKQKIAEPRRRAKACLLFGLDKAKALEKQAAQLASIPEAAAACLKAAADIRAGLCQDESVSCDRFAMGPHRTIVLAGGGVLFVRSPGSPKRARRCVPVRRVTHKERP